MKQAVILAGGKGTRLSERLGKLPKPLIDVCGTPLLERQILLLKRYGFTDILVLVNHAAEYIVNFCASKGNWGLNITCIDDGEPRGTAGAVLGVIERLADEFLVVYGDTMLEVDLGRFETFHCRATDSAATLFLHPNDHPHDSDLVEVSDSGQVTAFFPYPRDPSRFYPNLVNAALYWVRRSALARWRDTPGMIDFGKQMFPWMLQAGYRLSGFNSPEYIKDVGTPGRIDKVCGDFLSGKIARSSLAVAQPVVFLDRDGTINKEVSHLRSPEQFELLPGVEDAIRALNYSEYRCCVITNQPVIARGDCTFEGLQQIHNKMDTLLGQKGAFIDRVYYCPHHPDKGFEGERPELKLDCDCRKPKLGMIQRAAVDFNMDRRRSWVVGDTSVDVEVARRAGLRSILVETGYAGLDHRYPAVPDVTVPDLPAAVRFILEGWPRLLVAASSLVASVKAGGVVVVGGHSRSGKTTLATAMREALNLRGLNAKVLSLDRWLQPEAKRQSGVLGRYDLVPAQQALSRHESGANQQLVTPAYFKKDRSRVEIAEIVELAAHDVLIVEGTVALALSAGPGALRLMVRIDEAMRHARILREYGLRGNSAEQAEHLYQSRLSEEFPQLETLATQADAQPVPVWDILYPPLAVGSDD